jgi:hypothetical protein
MNIDGMNPFMNISTHSTWSIVLTILNLPPWLCNKRKYIMMSGLIPGPQQPGNDISTYYTPLVEDLKELWYNDRVQVWDEHNREYFGLKAILFVTVSDSPGTHNLLGHSKKAGCRCPHYFKETDSQHLSKSQKIVYMGHRRYIPLKYQFWSMKNQFNGNTEKRRPSPHLTGHEVYKMVKDFHVALGKWKRTSKNTEKDDMWKKRSIYWELARILICFLLTIFGDARSSSHGPRVWLSTVDQPWKGR